MQLHMVPKYISTLEAELPDSLYGLAESVTLLEIADVPHKGLPFLRVFTALFGFFFPKESQEVLGNKPGILFQKTPTELFFLLLNLY